MRLSGEVHRLFMKGASEIFTRKSARHVAVRRDGPNEILGGSGVETAPIGILEEDNISLTHDHVLRFSNFAHHRLVLS